MIINLELKSILKIVLLEKRLRMKVRSKNRERTVRILGRMDTIQHPKTFSFQILSTLCPAIFEVPVWPARLLSMRLREPLSRIHTLKCSTVITSWIKVSFNQRVQYIHMEWSPPVVLKHQDTWLYMITSKRSQSAVNVLNQTYRACLSLVYSALSDIVQFDVIIYKT